jgi:ATP-dependent helicase/DNAse subunit B
MVKSLSIKEENDQYPDVMYSKKQASYLLCKLTDVAKLYKEETPTYAALNKLINIDYQAYSNNYTNTNVYFPNTHLTHSYTAINMYYECPFKYYLSKILKIDPFETNFNAEFGTVVHETLRQINESNYDFDKFYDIEVNKRSWNASDLVFLDRLKPMMKEASDAILLHKRYMVNPSFVLETKLKFPLNQYADLEGRIDKLIVLDNKFLVVVDYKSGDPKIQLDRLQDGSSLQLPTYALLAANDPVYSKFDTIGLYIHSFNNKSLTKEDLGDKLIPSYLRLSGITTTNYEYAAYLDNSITGKGTRSSFISGYAVTAKNEVKASKTNIDPQQLSDYIDVTKQLYLDADSRIRNNSFPISPKFYGDDDNACKYCPYRDICFLRTSQIRNMKGSDDDE